MLDNRITEKNNFGVVPRRIHSVKNIEVIEVSLYQYEKDIDPNGYQGMVTEYWTKEGKLLTRFESIE